MMRQPMRQAPAKPCGVALVELMVALVIGTILTAAAIQIFVSSRQANRNIDAVSPIQENGRYAVRLLRTDIRMADFWGCSDDIPINNDLNDASVGGVDFPPGSASITKTGNGTAVTITVRGGINGSTRQIAADQGNPNSPIQLNDSSGIDVGESRSPPTVKTPTCSW